MSETTIQEVIEEVRKATSKFPTWPTDPIHAVAVLGEEFGELTKEVVQFTYEPHKSSYADIRMEALQTAAMAIRFVMSLDQYKYRAGEQHQQINTAGCAARDRGDYQLGHADECTLKGQRK